MHARKVSKDKWLFYRKLHLEEEGRKKEVLKKTNKKLKLNEQRKREKIVEVVLLY
jgi:hypothetical protein